MIIETIAKEIIVFKIQDTITNPTTTIILISNKIEITTITVLTNGIITAKKINTFLIQKIIIHLLAMTIATSIAKPIAQLIITNQITIATKLEIALIQMMATMTLLDHKKTTKITTKGNNNLI
jgi:hypothetical protein